MFLLTRFTSLAAASALVALTAASMPAHAGDSAQTLSSVGRHGHSVAECNLLKRAISRRTCQARLLREMKIDTAQNK
jgi:hypothetical protein